MKMIILQVGGGNPYVVTGACCANALFECEICDHWCCVSTPVCRCDVWVGAPVRQHHEHWHCCAAQEQCWEGHSPHPHPGWSDDQRQLWGQWPSTPSLVGYLLMVLCTCMNCILRIYIYKICVHHHVCLILAHMCLHRHVVVMMCAKYMCWFNTLHT